MCTVDRCEVDLRKNLYSNIVLSGGSTMFTGFGDRLLAEMRRLAPKDVKIRISAPQERLYGTWIGGSILASLDTFKKMCLGKLGARLNVGRPKQAKCILYGHRIEILGFIVIVCEALMYFLEKGSTVEPHVKLYIYHRLYCEEWIRETALKNLLKDERLLGSVGEVPKSVHKHENDKLRRISAGAEKKRKKRKIKHSKLKYKHKGSKNRREKNGQNAKKVENEQEVIAEADECKNKATPSGIQEKSSDFSDSTSSVVRKVEARNVKKQATCSSKGSTQINKFKKDEKKENKKLEEKEKLETSVKDKARQKGTNKSGNDSESIIEEKERKKKKVCGNTDGNANAHAKFVKSSGKIKVRNTTAMEKGRKASERESQNVRESGKNEVKKKSKIRKRKRTKISKDLDECDKIRRDKTKAKRRKSTLKSTSQRNKKKTRKVRKLKDRRSRQKNKNFIGKDESKIGGKKIKMDGELNRLDTVLTSGIEKESKKAEDVEALNSGRKPEIKLPEDHGKQDEISDSIAFTKQLTSTEGSSFTTSASSSTPTTDISISPSPERSQAEIVNESTACIDEKTGSISEEEEEGQEGAAAVVMKEPEEKVDVTPKHHDVNRNEIPASNGIRKGKRKIMSVFVQEKHNSDNTTITPKRIRYGMNKTEKASSDTSHGPGTTLSPKLEITKGMKADLRQIQKEVNNLDQAEVGDFTSSTSVAESQSSEARKDKIDEKRMMMNDGNNSSSSNVAFLSTTETTNNDQNINVGISDEKLERSNELKQKLEYVKDSEKEVTLSASPADTNTDVEQNEQNGSSDRSYINGLAQIQTILEIYGIEKEKTEAFNKLLDENLAMNEKEIGENLMKAVCDLPMNTELLQKVHFFHLLNDHNFDVKLVLEKMQYSGLLQKEEYKMLQKNLVPQAVNETVTIALLAQVIQRKKHKKSTP
ncbi:unnamed protein product [Litomosoides sigmodontis]|uniref:Uncharacterized protein n=1 Tax=Litomosoides sigmodontis TaxID=42156 RepID=A0A3P6TNA7_LITSI|nr:unnamed protein product [Litomosoides sigmodontis]